jgi:hypothetical protein
MTAPDPPGEHTGTAGGCLYDRETAARCDRNSSAVTPLRHAPKRRILPLGIAGNENKKTPVETTGRGTVRTVIREATGTRPHIFVIDSPGEHHEHS